MNWQLVAFDFDGTLVDSEPGIVRCIERTVESLGLGPEVAAAWRELIGLPLAEQLKRILPPDRRGDVEAGVELYRSFYSQLSEEEMGRPFPGIPELLEVLRGRAKLAIATSKSERGVRRVLGHLGWERWFEPVVTPEAVAEPKPHPESLLRILAHHGAAPAHAVYVGDSRFDMEMAAAAGVAAYGVSWGVGARASLEAAGAARCFDAPGALLRALAGRIEAQEPKVTSGKGSGRSP